LLLPEQNDSMFVAAEVSKPGASAHATTKRAYAARVRQNRAGITRRDEAPPRELFGLSGARRLGMEGSVDRFAHLLADPSDPPCDSCMDAMRNLWSFLFRGRSYHQLMLNTDFPETRTLTLVLPESEWRALRDAEPDAVGWLQSQIRARLASRPAPAPTSPPTMDYSVHDEY
jgi:hypothetical protein